MKVTLTYNEAAIMKAFGNKPEAFIPILGVEARLTPSEVQEGISLLEQKDLVQVTKSERFVRQTKKSLNPNLDWEISRAGHMNTSSSLSSRNKTSAVVLAEEIEKLRTQY